MRRRLPIPTLRRDDRGGRPRSKSIALLPIVRWASLLPRYRETRGLVPKGNLIEIGFEQLDKDPVGVLRDVYKQFGW